MRLIITAIALLACTLSQGQSGKAWNKVRSAYDLGKPYGGIRTCDRQLAGKSPNKEFLVLRAEGHNMRCNWASPVPSSAGPIVRVIGSL